jgi:MFS family permease
VDVATENDGTAAATARSLTALPFAVALVVIVLTYWTIDIVSPAYPDLQSDLHLSAKSTGLIFSLLFLGRLVGNFPAAFILQRIGSAGTAAGGGAILLVSTALASMAPSGLWLMPARVAQGVGVAFLVNACLRAVLGARPGRGAAMTYFSFAATVGGVFGLQSGGFLTGEFGWRAVFCLSTAVAGIITVGVMLTRLTELFGPRRSDPRPVRQSAEPVQLGALLPPLVLNFILFSNYSLFVALPLYTERAYDASPRVSSNLLMVITVVHLAAAFPTGRVIRNWGAQRTLAGGMVISLAGTALVLAAPSPLWIAAPMLLYGLGQAAATNAGGDIVLHLGGQSTRAVGMVRFSSDLGLVIAPYLTGALSDAFGYRSPFVALPLVMAGASIWAIQQAWSAGSRRV